MRSRGWTGKAAEAAPTQAANSRAEGASPQSRPLHWAGFTRHPARLHPILRKGAVQVPHCCSGAGG